MPFRRRGRKNEKQRRRHTNNQTVVAWNYLGAGLDCPGGGPDFSGLSRNGAMATSIVMLAVRAMVGDARQEA